MKLTDTKDTIRQELQHNAEFTRVKNTAEGHAWGIVEVEGVPFLLFRNVNPPNEVYLPQPVFCHYLERLHEIGQFAGYLSELLNE